MPNPTDNPILEADAAGRAWSDGPGDGGGVPGGRVGHRGARAGGVGVEEAEAGVDARAVDDLVALGDAELLGELVAEERLEVERASSRLAQVMRASAYISGAGMRTRPQAGLVVSARVLDSVWRVAAAVAVRFGCWNSPEPIDRTVTSWRMGE